MSVSNRQLYLSITSARRFVLGRQGLWPGRRWTGKEGTAQALRHCEALQLDPLNMVARSHDIALWGRVLAYCPEHLYEVAYQERRFFDYGGGLFMVPMSELPFWRVQMERWRHSPRMQKYLVEHSAVAEQVRSELRERGPLGNRDFDGNVRINSYRGRKDTALALYNLWLLGDVMVHHRRGFERIYDLGERVAPAEFNCTAPETEAENHFARKAIAFLGTARETGWRNYLSDALHRRVEPVEGRALLNRMIETGEVAPIQVEGYKETCYVLRDDLPLLETLASGGVPVEWQPLGPTTLDEVTFLAPLDIVSARKRAKLLFDFDYVWEVYKPVEQRRWGYYTLPILYGDRLVARLDPRLERKTSTLVINGFWHEDHAPLNDPAFAAALAGGLVRFAGMLGAPRLRINGLMPAGLWSKVGIAAADQLEVDSHRD